MLLIFERNAELFSGPLYASSTQDRKRVVVCFFYGSNFPANSRLGRDKRQDTVPRVTGAGKLTVRNHLLARDRPVKLQVTRQFCSYWLVPEDLESPGELNLLSTGKKSLVPGQMNVSKFIRRGLQCVAYTPIPQPRMKIHCLVDSPKQLVLPGCRGNSMPLASSYRCISRAKEGKETRANCSVVPFETVSTSSIRCTSSEAEVAGSEATDKQARRLIMYSKPGCCLCDGLKEKLSAIPGVELEIRNILTNPAWENAYQYEIPVLAYIREDGTEETIPRLSPRLTPEQLQKKLQAVLG